MEVTTRPSAEGADMAKVQFITSESMKSVATAAGINTEGMTFGACPFLVGDVLSFPAAPQLFFQVVGRVAMAQPLPADGEWLILLEPSPDPYLVLETPRA